MSRWQSAASNCVSGLLSTIAILLLIILFSLKNLIPVQFSFHTSSTPSRTTNVTLAEGSSTDKTEDQQNPMCPSCKKELNNNVIMHSVYPTCSVSNLMVFINCLLSVMKPCAHVTCKTCTDSLVRPARQCVICDRKLGEK